MIGAGQGNSQTGTGKKPRKTKTPTCDQPVYKIRLDGRPNQILKAHDSMTLAELRKKLSLTLSTPFEFTSKEYPIHPVNEPEFDVWEVAREDNVVHLRSTTENGVRTDALDLKVPPSGNFFSTSSGKSIFLTTAAPTGSFFTNTSSPNQSPVNLFSFSKEKAPPVPETILNALQESETTTSASFGLFGRKEE